MQFIDKLFSSYFFMSLQRPYLDLLEIQLKVIELNHKQQAVLNYMTFITMILSRTVFNETPAETKREHLKWGQMVID